jgi:hypothetical protein
MHMSRAKFLPLGLLAAVLVAVAGCGSKSPAKTAIKGKVWYRGEPLPGGLVAFVPDGDRGNNGPLAKGTIAADGTFSLAPETAPGWYRVAIAPLPAESTSSPTPSNPYPGVPLRYRNPSFSGIQGEIKQGAENTFEFYLEDL